ncbi:MAG: hypothetical protein C3F11_07955, partial [Methylocystaceae bacterium]
MIARAADGAGRAGDEARAQPQRRFGDRRIGEFAEPLHFAAPRLVTLARLLRRGDGEGFDRLLLAGGIEIERGALTRRFRFRVALRFQGKARGQSAEFVEGAPASVRILFARGAESLATRVRLLRELRAFGDISPIGLVERCERRRSRFAGAR